MINEEDVFQPDVLFVGAGPVGLLTAIQTKLLAPKQKILMLERNKTYTRNHILSVQPYAYENSIPDERLQNILMELGGNRAPNANRSVDTSKIERELKAYAIELGIQFENIWVTNQFNPNIMVLDSEIQTLPDYDDLNIGPEDCFVFFKNFIYFANSKDKTLTNTAKTVQDYEETQAVIHKVNQLNSITSNIVIPANELKAAFLQINSHDQKMTFYTIMTFLSTLKTGTPVIHPDNLRALYPSAHTIVGADGARSIIRQTFFDDEKSTNETCQYIVEVKYRVNNVTSPISGTDYTSGLSQINHFVHEFVGKMSDYSSPVSLFFFVDKETHDEILTMGGTPRNPLQLNAIDNRNSCIAKLANSIHPWIAYRNAIFGDVIIPETVKIAAVALNIYQSKNTIVYHTNESNQRTRYLLVGDAFLGVPFQDSYSRGARGAVEAARFINCNPDHSPSEEQEYNNFMQNLASEAIHRARKKSGQANFGRKAGALLHNASATFIHPFIPKAPMDALMNARITPPTFLRRYGRSLTSGIGFLALAGIFSAIALTVFTAWPLWVAIGGSLLAAAALVLTINLVLIIAAGITRWVKSNNPQGFEVWPEEALRNTDIVQDQQEQVIELDTDDDNSIQIITASSNGNQQRTGTPSVALKEHGFFSSDSSSNPDQGLNTSETSYNSQGL